MDVLIATTNVHKIAEYRRLFAESAIAIRTPSDAGVAPPEVNEDGATFGANAAKKAIAFAQAAGIPVLADDSGICVDSLAGAPGVRSARFGSPHLDDAGRLYYLLECLKDVPVGRRGAHYSCALALATRGGMVLAVEGRLYGEIDRVPSAGSTGFGYDPVFVVPRFGRTVADISPEEKDAVSHRGNAVRHLLSMLGRRSLTPGTLNL